MDLRLVFAFAVVQVARATARGSAPAAPGQKNLLTRVRHGRRHNQRALFRPIPVTTMGLLDSIGRRKWRQVP
jgi:hypothetical protein